MKINKLQSAAKSGSFSGILIAWTVVLLVSDLPDAIWQALAGASPAGLIWVKAGLLLLLVILGRAWKRLYSLRPFFILLLMLSVGL